LLIKNKKICILESREILYNMAQMTANQEQELRDAFNLFDTGIKIREEIPY
jgi:Ca2+-binding EF-hand superfamily protein